MMSDTLDLLTEHATEPTRESVDWLLTEVLTLATGDMAETARQLAYMALRYRASAELGAFILDVRTKPRGLNVQITQSAVVKLGNSVPAKRRRGKPRAASRLPDGLNTKTVGKFAYWYKCRARMNGVRITNREAARVELTKLLRGLEPTEREIVDVAKRISESEGRSE
jgi:hypothetical protein